MLLYYLHIACILFGKSLIVALDVISLALASIVILFKLSFFIKIVIIPLD